MQLLLQINYGLSRRIWTSKNEGWIRLWRNVQHFNLCLVQRNLEDRGTRVRCCVPGRLTSSTEIFRKRESGCVMAVRIRANVSLKKITNIRIRINTSNWRRIADNLDGLWKWKWLGWKNSPILITFCFIFLLSFFFFGVQSRIPNASKNVFSKYRKYKKNSKSFNFFLNLDSKLGTFTILHLLFSSPSFLFLKQLLWFIYTKKKKKRKGIRY